MARLRVRSAPDDVVPFVDPATGSVYAFNGEIYRCGDAVPDGGLDEARGVGDGSEPVDGMYAMVTARPGGVLEAVRDPLGIKPLYVREAPQGVAVASEVVPLLHAFGDVPRVRLEAFAQFLLTGRRVVDGGTFFAGIRPVAPGEHMTLEAGEIRKSVRPSVPRLGGVEVGPTEIRAAAEDAVDRMLLADRQLGLALSGGVDSTILAALLSQRGVRDLPTVSVCPQDTGDGVQSLDDLGLPEVAVGTWRHRWVPFRPDELLDGLPSAIRVLGEPTAMSSVPMYASLARLAKESGITVLIVGEGADELFAGYNRYVPLYQGAHRTPLDFYLSPERMRLVGQLLGTDLCIAAYDAVRLALDDAAETALQRRGRTPTTVDVVREFEYQHSLEPLLRRTDHLLMAEGIEGRTPFLHAGLPGVAMNCSATDLVRRDRTKAVLRDAFADIVPSRCLDQRKHPFRASLRTSFGGHGLTRVQQQLRAATDQLHQQLGVRPDGLRSLLDRVALGEAEALTAALCLLAGAEWLRWYDSLPSGSEGRDGVI